MPNTSGQAYALTVMAPIVEGREPQLRGVLAALPEGEKSPLARTARTHFARFVVLHDLVHQAPPQQPDRLGSAYLIFASDFDGSLESYLHDLCRLMGQEADEVWGNCIGYPGSADTAAFAAWIRRNQIDTTFFFAAYPDASVATVRARLRLRERMIEFAVRSQGLPAAELQSAFRAAFADVPGEEL